VEVTSQSRVGQNAELNSWDGGQGSTLSYLTLLGKGLTCHSQSRNGATHLLPSEIRNIFDQLGDSGSRLKSE
jgi:hypothetical protein